MKTKYTSDEITQANIEYHTKLAKHYDQEQPHYLPENVRRVNKILAELAYKYKGGMLLDVGCGTGFILKIAEKHFKHLAGIDITQAMLDRVDLSNGNVEVRLADSSKIPFEQETFDVCTSNSFLHHLPKLTPTLKEVFRCLKKGGTFYVDLEPNYYCWKAMQELRTKGLSEILLRERESVIDVSDEFSLKHNLTEHVVKLAEYQKYYRMGLKEESIVKQLTRIGFTQVYFDYQWFLGQGRIIHEVSEEQADEISEHLKRLLPLTRELFKYFSITVIK